MGGFGFGSVGYNFGCRRSPAPKISAPVEGGGAVVSRELSRRRPSAIGALAGPPFEWHLTTFETGGRGGLYSAGGRRSPAGGEDSSSKIRPLPLKRVHRTIGPGEPEESQRRYASGASKSCSLTLFRLSPAASIASW